MPMEDTSLVRIGIIGAGSNTISRHIPGLQAIKGVEVVGICNRSRASSERVAQQFGISKLYENWREIIDDPNLDAIVIGTWPYMHCPITLAALEAGKHVMCESRMAMNAREAHQMLTAARANPQLVTQVVPTTMASRVENTVVQLLAEGYLGEVLAIELRSGNTFLDPEAPLQWRQDFNVSGFNTMFLGIWYEALMRWVGEATRVMAMGKTCVTMRKDATGCMQALRIPDHLDVIADMACGAQAHFQFSEVTGLAAASEVFVFGSAGTLRFSEGALYGGQRDDAEFQEISILPGMEREWRAEEEFINAIRGQEVITRTTFEDGVKYMEFTEAVIRSMAEGRAISLPL